MLASSAAMGDAAFSLSCVVRETRVEHRQDGVGGAAVSITPRMSWKGRARARACFVRTSCAGMAHASSPETCHARRGAEPAPASKSRASGPSPARYVVPRDALSPVDVSGTAQQTSESFAIRERLHSPHLRPCDFRPFTETTTHAVDSSRARRRGGVRSRGRVAARCRVASLSAAAGDRRGYPAA